MYPLLKEGQRVFCFKAFNFFNLKINDLVVFEKKGYGRMIKQIVSIEKDGFFVKGIGPMSIDSRDFGLLTKKEILYKVVFTIKKR